AYATAWLTTTQGMSPWLGLLFALLLTGSAALAIGMLTLRLGGHCLPLSTIAWGLSIALLFGNIEALGRHSGMPNIPALRLGPSPFDVRASIEYLLMAVAGGLGQLAGALVGAGVVMILKNGLQDLLPLLSQRGGQLEAVAFAAIFILLLHFARAGVMGFVARL